MPRSHVTISICTIQNPPCWMKLLPEYQAYKTLPAQRACSPSNELTKPSLLNKPAPRVSSLQNPPFLTSLLPEHQSYKKNLLNKPAPRASRIQNLPCLTSLLSEHPAYNTLPAKLACSPSIQLTIPSLLNEPVHWTSSLQACKSNLIKIRSLIRSHISSDLKEQIKGSNFNKIAAKDTDVFRWVTDFEANNKTINQVIFLEKELDTDV